MATVYEPADKGSDVVDLMERVLQKFERFRPIRDCDARIEILWASNEDDHPIRWGGCPAVWKTKVVGGEERSRGGPDVRILLDERRFNHQSGLEQEATLFSALYGLTWSKKLDAYKRPKFRLEVFNIHVTGFIQAYQEYGRHSLESRSYEVLKNAFSQLLLSFGDQTESTEALASGRTPEDVIRRVISALEAFDDQARVEFGQTSLSELELPELLVTQLDGQGYETVDNVLARVTRGFFLDRIDHMNESRALMVAETIAVKFAAWSAALLRASAAKLNDDVAAAVRTVEASRAEVNAAFPIAESPTDEAAEWRKLFLRVLDVPSSVLGRIQDSTEMLTLGELDDFYAEFDEDHEGAIEALATTCGITSDEARSVFDALASVHTEPTSAPSTWRELSIDALGLDADLVQLARQAGVDTAGALDAWLRGDSKGLEDSARDAYIEALDAVEMPNRSCQRCLFVRAGGDVCPRCQSKAWNRTADDPGKLDELQAQSWKAAAEHSSLDIYGQGEREPDPSSPGTLRIGTKDVPIKGPMVEEDDAKPKKRRKPKLKSFDVYDCPIGGSSRKFVGTVEASDPDKAKQEAIGRFPELKGRPVTDLRVVVVPTPKTPKQRDAFYGNREDPAEVNPLLDLFSVYQARKKVPLYLVRATSLREAVDYVKSQHPATSKLDVKPAPVDFDTKGFIVKIAVKSPAAAAI